MVDISLDTIKEKTFSLVNFGCRVNAAETNQFGQYLINKGFTVDNTKPGIIFVNTCSITKKGNYESLSKIRQLRKIYPESIIIVSGCANPKPIYNLPNIITLDNKIKEKILSSLSSSYSPKICDKYSHDQKFILKIQSGCNHGCSYCIVPQKRPYLWSLPINEAVNTVNQAIKDGYTELIITGVNLNQYHYGFFKLINSLLEKTTIPLISFGSVPLNVIDDSFIALYQNPKFNSRLKHFLHIPLQSGSDKILKLMNRPYNQKIISSTFNKLRNIDSLSFGTDIIVGFPTETDADFQETLCLCKSIGFKKIHTFRFSFRPETQALKLYNSQTKHLSEKTKDRARQIRLAHI